jgi:hypothetical protein
MMQNRVASCYLVGLADRGAKSQPNFTGHAQMTRLAAVLLALAPVLMSFVAPAQAENVVRWATPTPAESFDPYGHDVLQTYWWCCPHQTGHVAVGE